MVKIAVAGGTGNVATEVLRAAIRSGNHEITIFTRSEPPKNHIPDVTYKQVNYHDLPSLTTALRGTHTVLSFLIAHLDTNNTAQKNLIHASIASGVKRFAPSEWSLANNSGVGPYANKDLLATYLADLDAKNELNGMQYCLFQPSVFMDYFAHPYPLSPGLITWTFFVDVEKRRAMVLDDGNHPFVVTSVADVSGILALALDDPAPWPKVGGMQGCKTTINDLLALAKDIRGGEWLVEQVKSEDIEKGVLKTSWVPEFDHPVIPVDSRDEFSRQFVVEFFKAMGKGKWVVGREWNERTDYGFMALEEYLRRAWEGKP